MDVNIQKSGVVNYTADLGVFEAITSTTTGEIVTFKSNVLDAPCEVTCTLNPVQDLHGQDYPYPAGGGKNLIPSLNPMPTSGTVLREFSTPLSVSYVTVSFKFTGSFANGGAALIVGKDSDNNNAFLVAMGWFKKASDNTTLSANTIYTNELVYFSASVTAPIKSIIYTGYSGFSSGATLVDAMIETGSTRTAYAPYSNICPITGHTELNLVHTGANIWDEITELGIYNTTTGQPEVSGFSIRGKNRFAVLPNTTYYANNNYVRRLYYDENDNYISYKGGIGADTTPANCHYMRIYLADVYGTTYNHDISINYPSTDTSYHAYTASTTTTTFGTTVYGGTLDVVSGVLTDKMSTKKKFRDYYWGYNSTYQFFYCGISDIVSSGSGIVCDCYETVDSTTGLNDKQIKIRVGGISLMDTRYTDTTSFLNAMGDNEFVYELATPTTTQLTPQEVKSLLGSNNFYHDGNGEIRVKYFTIRSYSLDGFFENNTDRLSISQTFINSTDFIEI